MFSEETNGYKKTEVEMYIQRMKANYESKIMEEKLKVLDCEKKVLDMKNEQLEIENKEKNIITALNVIEKAKKFQEEGSKNFYNLIIDKIELLIKELNLKFPQLKNNQNFLNILTEFEAMLKTYRNTLEQTTNITHPIYSENDSMRMLLNKMQDYKRVQEPAKEVHISTNQSSIDTSPIKTQTTENTESGFSFEEALNPTEDLEEIMKAFDFYNQN